MAKAKPKSSVALGHNVVLHRFLSRTTTTYGWLVGETSNWVPKGQAFKDLALGLGFLEPMDYLWEHELLHILLPRELLGLEIGYVHAQAASGQDVSPLASSAEEKLIYYAQRFFHQRRSGGAPTPWDSKLETLFTLVKKAVQEDEAQTGRKVPRKGAF